MVGHAGLGVEFLLPILLYFWRHFRVYQPRRAASTDLAGELPWIVALPEPSGDGEGARTRRAILQLVRSGFPVGGRVP